MGIHIYQYIYINFNKIICFQNMSFFNKREYTKSCIFHNKLIFLLINYQLKNLVKNNI